MAERDPETEAAFASYKALPMGKRLGVTLGWVFQGFVQAVILMALAFGAFAAWGALFASSDNPLRYGASVMMSGLVLFILFASSIVPGLLSGMTTPEGAMRTCGGALGFLLIMSISSEILKPL